MGREGGFLADHERIELDEQFRERCEVREAQSATVPVAIAGFVLRFGLTVIMIALVLVRMTGRQGEYQTE